MWPSSRKLRARDCPRHQSRSAVPFLRQQVAFKNSLLTQDSKALRVRGVHARHAIARLPPSASFQSTSTRLDVSTPSLAPSIFFCVPRPPQGQPTRGSWRSPLHDGRGDVCLIDCTNGTLDVALAYGQSNVADNICLARGKQGQDPSLRRSRRCTLYPSSTVNRIGRNNGVRNKKAPRKALVY